jgi:hypothetical protein
MVADKKRRDELGAAVSESESSGLRSKGARREERGERICCGCGDTGDDGGESAKEAFARAAERLEEAVGVMSRLVRGLDRSCW